MFHPRLRFGVQACFRAIILLFAGWTLLWWADGALRAEPVDRPQPLGATFPPIFAISIAPSGQDRFTRIRNESSIPPEVNYFMLYRGTHPYFQVSPLIHPLTDFFKIMAVSEGRDFIDSTGGIGDAERNYCYCLRALVTPSPDTTTWYYSSPSNIVCDWDYPLVAPSALTHWNQVVIPLQSQVTDTLGGWARRDSGATEIDEWIPATQSWSLRTNKVGTNWLFGNRATRYNHPYHITGDSIRGVHSVWGDTYFWPIYGTDTCYSLLCNEALTDLNNVVVQAAWHWFQCDSSSSFAVFGQKLYDGTPETDYGVREILEWSAATQSWTSRCHWTGTAWMPPLRGVKVYNPYMLRRATTNIPWGPPASSVCWPPLMR